MENIDKAALVERIKAIRERLGLSHQAFAKALHVTPCTVIEWETNIRLPRTHTLEKISILGNVELQELKHGSKEEWIGPIIKRFRPSEPDPPASFFDLIPYDMTDTIELLNIYDRWKGSQEKQAGKDEADG